MKEQIEEMRETIHAEIIKAVESSLVTWTEFADYLGEALYNAGSRKQEWISVEDMLPEKADTYLVSRKDGLVTMTYFCERFHSSVTHWMPLPEPPKMKGGVE